MLDLAGGMLVDGVNGKTNLTVLLDMGNSILQDWWSHGGAPWT